MAMALGLIGAGLGAAAGATAPRPPIFDYKKEGMRWLTGSMEDRIKDFDPIKQEMIRQSLGKGLMLGGAERARMAASEIARLRGLTLGTHQGINERSLARGQGAGSGMTEAAHLKADIAGLNAERGLLGQIAASEAGQRIARQQNAMGMATDLFQSDQGKENAAIGAQWQSKVDRTMAGTPLHNALAGAAGGFSSMGPSMGAFAQQGHPWWGTMARG